MVWSIATYTIFPLAAKGLSYTLQFNATSARRVEKYIRQTYRLLMGYTCI
ncbi:hypothetical protein HMPREF0645_0107 [Hallella bergensis DSM 17361]|uniref:Uncharacterized protein n=1 Tax=Hallella bergensis DSM 17361 TaxID=585502 RepID=D1PT22_9BACT|nr:hypothetical protein HMPREF0645_0107 [Hallella bergensis DSM 17361]